MQYNLNIDYEDVEFTNPAGLVLRGWFVPASPKAVRTTRLGMVCVHGGGRDRRAWLRHVPMFHNRGYDVLLFDFSEHGVRYRDSSSLCMIGTRL
jgi:pimeloyl-ACP methyl ester carboxylesterase